MADSLIFDGVDDKIVCTLGSWAGTGAFTIACVLKFITQDKLQCFVTSTPVVATSFFFKVNTSEALHMSGSVDNFATPGITVTVADDWTLVAFAKPSGSVPGDFDRYKYSTTTWTHSDGLTNYANLSGMTSLVFGQVSGNVQPTNVNLLIAGFWDSELTEANVETLTTGTQAWVDLAPQELFRFDTTSTITSLTGTSTETSRVGTTLDSGDAPAGWVDVMDNVIVNVTVNF